MPTKGDDDTCSVACELCYDQVSVSVHFVNIICYAKLGKFKIQNFDFVAKM